MTTVNYQGDTTDAPTDTRRNGSGPPEAVPVHEALLLVMADVQAVGKTGWNEGQKFSFRGIDAVVNAVGPAFRKHGVVCLPRVLSSEAENYPTKTGTMMRRVTLEVEFTFVGPDGSTLLCSALGEAADSGDKAVSKAHSVAYRTALLQALCIPTDEPDPDTTTHERMVEPEPEPIDAETLALLRVRLDRVKADDAANADLREWWQGNGLPPVGRLSPGQGQAVARKLTDVEVAYALVAEKPGGEPTTVLDVLTSEQAAAFEAMKAGVPEAPQSAERPLVAPTVPDVPGGAQGGSQAPLGATDGWCDGDVTDWVLGKAAAMTAGDIRLAFVEAGLESPRGKVDELRRSYSFWLFEAVAVGLLRACSGFALSSEAIVAANLETKP